MGNKFIEPLKYLLLSLLGLLVVFIGSKFQHVIIPQKSELFISNFLRYNLTVPVQLVFISIGFIICYFSRLNPLLVGITLFLFFPAATLAEALLLYNGNTSFGLFPFVLILEFFFAVPTILASYLGRYIAEISRMGGGNILHEIKTRHPLPVTCLSFGILGMLIIGLCSLFHFHFNNLLQYENNVGKNAFYFYANYSNQAILVFAIVGLLIGYKFRTSPYLAGLSLYLIFPISSVFSIFFNILPFKEGLFMEYIPFLIPTMIAVALGQFGSKITSKRKMQNQ